MPFIPNTDADREAMLERIGVPDFEALISNIPKQLRFNRELNLPPALSELEIAREIHQKTRCNESVADAISFLGGGAYDHFIPAAVGAIVSRSEFYTAYTPYQPEVSQLTLQAIYEYQSMIDEAPLLDKDLNPVIQHGRVIMVPVGSKAVKKMIEKYQPFLGLHGHIHESSGCMKRGRTYCVNPGSE
ncbi:MAG: hypothetical protein ONB13_08070, partial [candidate division KSB1 bacterium]|nr:hypothetical protein [candidate division KSB1 bacterium]